MQNSFNSPQDQVAPSRGWFTLEEQEVGQMNCPLEGSAASNAVLGWEIQIYLLRNSKLKLRKIIPAYHLWIYKHLVYPHN